MESPSPPQACLPNFDLEAKMMDLHGVPVAGVDEAGRGPWAGPVVVAAVVLDPDRIPDGLNDSKLLTAQAREDRYEEIVATARVSVVIGQVRRIDRDNILQATLWGMRTAFRSLEIPNAAALVDGNAVPKRFPGKVRAVIGGDGKSLSIAAASIVAKVTRDRIMVKLAKRYRGYGWENNKGYGTPEHASGIERHGLCPHHRRSFAPIQRILAEGCEMVGAGDD
ncbi:ribonuclease HII [Methyloceanibacter caenitepidi]|uniref:Ribonuclease HII n=1 Tax=Methyloceanibacter caenitepidi TaxID=1384459 RepID=A0A0A8K0I4_9HYPH|nr:ribonuclease HII [Methyloceanibacter caenitepidi]BAQ16483.1 ribonuclease HII [Methyloceanibacter caenitepidi]